MENNHLVPSRRWYDSKITVTLLCVFVFPIGIYALWKNQQIYKVWKVVVTVFILLFVAFLLDDKEQPKTSEATASLDHPVSDTSTSKPASNPIVATLDTKSKKASLGERLERELKSLTKKTFDGSSYRKSMESLQLEIALFDVWAKMIKEAEGASDQKEVQLGKQLAYHVRAVQSREFPQMRRAYQKIVSQKLWENDIEVILTGYNFTILNLAGGAFAANRNKKAFQMQINDIMKMLRFKRVTYRFTKYDEEHTYCDIDSPRDNEIKRLTEL